MDNGEAPRELTDSERIRLRTARNALKDVLSRKHGGNAGEAVFQQFLQTGSVYSETLDALHVPENAGGYAEALRRILLRTRDGWGRWVSCSAGWYPLICELDAALAELDPGYVVHQCKQKLGTLRFYCESENPLYRSLDSPFHAIIRAAEARSAVTCELCSAAGTLHTHHGLLRTVCPACAAAGGYEPIGELVEELTADRLGVWRVSTASGVQHILDLRFGRWSCYGGGSADEDATTRPMTVDLWPRLGGDLRVVVDGGTSGDEWRVGESVEKIERLR